MALTKQKKTETVQKLGAALKGAVSIVFVGFKGLTVSEANELRTNLRKERAGYVVAKKTLLKRALGELPVSGGMPDLQGEIAVAYLSSQAGGKDAVAPARGVQQFAKAHEGHLSIEGGVFEGVYKNKDEMRAIALIPSLDTLRAQFVQLINSPLQRFAVVLSAKADKQQ